MYSAFVCLKFGQQTLVLFNMCQMKMLKMPPRVNQTKNSYSACKYRWRFDLNNVVWPVLFALISNVNVTVLSPVG